MRAWFIYLMAFAGSCASHPMPVQATPNEFPIDTAEAFIGAFYSFDVPRLRAALSDAAGSKADILYYQQWAEAGHYIVLNRKPCRLQRPNEIVCPVTVRDDLIPALGLALHVTDVFHFAFQDGRIVKVWNSSDDPPEFHQAMEWLRRERPAIFAGPCRGMWKEGLTPKDCVRAVVNGFEEFTAQRRAGN